MPVVQSQMPVFSNAAAREIATAFLTRPAAALFAGAEIGLFTAGPTPITPFSVFTDYTEATFPGYSRTTASFAGPVNVGNGAGIALTADSINYMAGSTPAETVLGYFLILVTDEIVISELFDTPIPMAILGDYISLQVFVPVAYEVPIT